MVGLAMIILLTLACILGPRLLPYDELFIDLRARFAPVSGSIRKRMRGMPPWQDRVWRC